MRSRTLEIQIRETVSLNHKMKMFSTDPRKEYMKKMREMEIIEEIKRRYQEKRVI